MPSMPSKAVNAGNVDKAYKAVKAVNGDNVVKAPTMTGKLSMKREKKMKKGKGAKKESR